MGPLLMDGVDEVSRSIDTKCRPVGSLLSIPYSHHAIICFIRDNYRPCAPHITRIAINQKFFNKKHQHESTSVYGDSS